MTLNMSQWIDPMELEKIRTNEQAIFIQKYLISQGYKNISSFSRMLNLI